MTATDWGQTYRSRGSISRRINNAPCIVTRRGLIGDAVLLASLIAIPGPVLPCVSCRVIHPTSGCAATVASRHVIIILLI